MTSNELIEPIKPVAPEKNDEDLHELRTALAAAVTALSKNKSIIIIESDIRTWGEPEGLITFRVKKTHALYTEYHEKERQYQREKRDYDNHVAAIEHGVTVEQYLEAKKRFDEYQSKKCDKAPAHEIEHFIEKVISLQINKVDDQSVPELTTA